MKVEQTYWTSSGGWRPYFPGSTLREADLLLVFASRELFREAPFFGMLSALFPDAILAGCSTAGEIFGTNVSDGGLVCNAIHFDHTQCRSASVRLAQGGSITDAGRDLASQLDPEGLRHVLIISDGIRVNGTELIDAMTEVIPPEVSITGGLAGDADLFRETYVCSGSEPVQGAIMAVGLYGDRLVIGRGSQGGWDPFGPERLITKSRGNQLYELDGQSALSLYKQYLGQYADQLPGSALLFPLAVRIHDQEEELVRTILGVDEASNSMIFAGDMPEGGYARLMKANIDRLIDGAIDAATQCKNQISPLSAEFALLISCVGRKMVLKQRVEEEVEGVRDILGTGTPLAGFYSYGEIGPCAPNQSTRLLNQTMTITTFTERTDS
ncbi:MAG: FIST C-terminal domain-containing protein [Kiritimatiellae bacterium]|nr:FIST C-terminal domain-containing protein [Kiritimatiellia bacterium]